MPVKKTIYKTNDHTVFKSALLKILVDLDMGSTNNNDPATNNSIRKTAPKGKNN